MITDPKNAMEHWKYTLDYNQSFTNELNFSFKKLIKSWYYIKQINLNQIDSNSNWVKERQSV